MDDPDGALTVAAELGHLPLALAQAAAVLRGQHIGFATYLQRLRTIPVSQYLTRRSGEPYLLGTAEAILLSLHEAGLATDPATGALLRLLAVLSPDGVNRALLSTTGEEASEVDGLLDQMGEASIVAITVDGVSVTMHRLVQRVIRDTALHDGSYHETLTRAAARLGANMFDERDGWKRRGDGAQLVANIELLWTHSHAVPESLADLPERLLRLRRWAVRQLLATADLDRAMSLGDDVLADCRRLLGAEHPDTLTSANNLAGAYQSAGQLDRAIALDETTLDESRRLLGAEHPLCRTLADNLRRAQSCHADPDRSTG